jgi:hypothetical protein
MAHVPGRKEWDNVRFHHATKLKTYALLISGIFHLIFSDYG